MLLQVTLVIAKTLSHSLLTISYMSMMLCALKYSCHEENTLHYDITFVPRPSSSLESVSDS